MIFKKNEFWQRTTSCLCKLQVCISKMSYIYGRSNETNEGSECSQNGKYIDKIPRDLRHILNFPSQFYLALLPKYKSSKHSVRYFFFISQVGKYQMVYLTHMTQLYFEVKIPSVLDRTRVISECSEFTQFPLYYIGRFANSS